MTAFRVVFFLYLLGWQCEDAFRVQSRRGRGKVKRFQGKFTNIDTKHSLNMAEASHEVTNPSRNRSNGSFEVARIVSAVASGSLGVSGSKVKNESSTTQLSPSRIVQDSELQSDDNLRVIASFGARALKQDHVPLIYKAAAWLEQGNSAAKMDRVFMTHLEKKEVELDVPLRYQDASSLRHVRGRTDRDRDVWLWHATTRSAYNSILREKKMRPGKAYGSMWPGIYMASSPVHAIRKARQAFGTENGRTRVHDEDLVFAAPVSLGEVFRVGEKPPKLEDFPIPNYEYSLFWEFPPNVTDGSRGLNGAEWTIGYPQQIKVSQSIPFVWATNTIAPVLSKLVQLADAEMRKPLRTGGN